MRRIFLVLIALMLVACIELPPTGEVTETPSAEPTGDPTNTSVPPTATFVPTATSELVPVVVDIANPGFEQGWHDGLGGNVPNGWTAFACEGCPAADGRVTGLHEIVPSTVRVHGDSYAVKQFQFQRPGDFGIYQDVAVPDGCTRLDVSVWVQIWSANEWADVQYNKDKPNFDEANWRRWTGHARVGFNPDGSFIFDEVPYTSDRATADDRRAVAVRIGAGPAPSNPLASPMIYSPSFGFQYTDKGYTVYDNWTQITHSFPVASSIMRLALRANNIWGNVHNDVYWDDVSAICYVGGGVPQLPTATLIPPTPTQERIFDPQIQETGGRAYANTIKVYADHTVDSPQTNTLNTSTRISAIFLANNGDRWASLSGGYWVEHPEYPLYIWVSPQGWTPLTLNGVTIAENR